MADSFDIKDFTLGTAKTVKTKTIGGKEYPAHIVYDEAGTATTVKAASTAPVATDTALVATLSPNTAEVGTPVTGVSQDTGGVGISGWLSSLRAVLGISSAAKVVTDVNGTIQQYLRGLVSLFASVTFTNARLLVRGEPRLFDATATTLTRPANTTAYSAGDSISNNATAGSVTALPATVSDTNDDLVIITSLQLDTNDTGLAANTPVRVFVYNSDPTASSGVGAGDNVAFSNKRAGLIGTFTGVFTPMSDGGRATCIADAGAYVISKPVSGAQTFYFQHQTLGAFTPSANSTTIDTRVRGMQGRA